MLKIELTLATPVSRPLAAAAVVAALAGPAMAQSIDELVAFRPDNRAGSAAAAATIAEMIAERSGSDAVRSRARAIGPSGVLSVGADELLMDIGAHAFIGSITGSGSVLPVAVPPVARPVAPTPPAATPAAATPQPQRNWGISERFSGEMRDLGGSLIGGEGGGASSSGGGSSTGGGGVGVGGAAGNFGGGGGGPGGGAGPPGGGGGSFSGGGN